MRGRACPRVAKRHRLLASPVEGRSGAHAGMVTEVHGQASMLTEVARKKAIDVVVRRCREGMVQCRSLPRWRLGQHRLL
jgi:hypothetical protein